MNFQTKVTNKDKFDQTEVDLSGIKGKTGAGSFIGDVEIDGKTFTGEHGSHDYQEEYGFVIVARG